MFVRRASVGQKRPLEEKEKEKKRILVQALSSLGFSFAEETGLTKYHCSCHGGQGFLKAVKLGGSYNIEKLTI